MRIRIACQTCFGILLILLVSIPSFGQKKNDVFVDKNGLMRWANNKEEVKGFGINYTAMFAHAYKTAIRRGITLESAMEEDIYHFARLGFDLFRVHVWDTEISDSVGNLLNNEHLRLFDFALNKMKERGMNFVITPIAFWGNGWPERDDKTPGFARKYGKDACLTNPDAIAAQEKYLFQFLNHVNAYNNIAYKDDPAIIAFEVSNEPHHREEPAKVTAYINRMVKSMRNTGCKKPILYNISHSIQLMDAYFAADIQGGTFQWYPTGLGAGHELGGNLLVNVDRYVIPFAENPGFKKGAKIVYEFDAADVGRSYIYPAMARSFREAGIQIATHFAYDPTYMADVNTEYGTHYMNLAYAPQKALSLMISSEVFHEIPTYKSYGNYPANSSFGNFRVDYENDLAEMNSATKFLYTNNTRTRPVEEKLEKIAGYGNSPLIQYDGAGAYFLDQIEKGVWRLEVMPDAVWIADPFKKASPKRKVAVIDWNERQMRIQLADLGNHFAIRGINAGNTSSATSLDGNFRISPGTYLLVKNGVTPKSKPNDRFRNIRLNEFAAPKETIDKTIVLHEAPDQLTSGKEFVVNATIASPDSIQSAEVFGYFTGFRQEVFRMQRTQADAYSVTIPGDKIKEGVMRYHIVVKTKNGSLTFPSGLPTHPWDWDFYDDSPYKTKVLASGAPIFLYDAGTDEKHLSRLWVRGSTVSPSAEPGKGVLSVNIEKLFREDPENKNARPVHDYSIRYFAGDKIEGRRSELITKSKIIFTGNSLNNKNGKVQIALISSNGGAIGGVINLTPDKKEHSVAISEMKPVAIVTLPRPYPTFLSYYFTTSQQIPFKLESLESIQISIGPGLTDQELAQPNGVAIESVRLE